MYFYFYCWVTQFLAIYVLGLNIYMITHNKSVKINTSDENFVKLTVSQFCLALYGLIVTMLLLALTCYHTSIVTENETTQEELRDKYTKWGGNPYNLTSSQNWQYFFRK